MANKRFDVTHVPGAATIAIVTFLALYIPVLILVVNAFNGSDTAGRWEGLSLRWFAAALDNAAFRSAAVNSVIVALAAALLSTCLATAVALAVTRGRQIKGQGSIVIIVNQPLLVPEIVFGIALMVVLAQVKQVTGYQGLGYLIAAHTTFCIPFAFLPIRARLAGMDLTLETASMDLYAGRFYTFRRVTLPLLLPGILTGFMLAFVISLDNVVVSSLVKSPGQETLPTYLMGELRRNLTSEIYAISALLLFASISIVAASWVITRTKQ
ncbi:spermidine/putrescine transport system permease protein [Pseudosulfitobacter pseudonitzschiae]|uniref:Spermidine/putrescine transport system permease protein PotC n=1 Tax=Pseudosulfitobacter pseudonitzschiae TaxID=1402135 RepID=A0A073J051_9RHOB|nr:ABC transporter permease [Pseudosulfitobacter pseudonitzschiae]KEJ95250.1 ABC transporter permease [Pseudosulfitobacter pseudonitzschiae]QKS11496.1 ABC transporter permease [Pseudosulfitobacter pseudonitzschiae]SHF86762.1 spermidine/putrescine transport system permease protein [Pseudosulfitobacter pseudonitzschiae]